MQARELLYYFLFVGVFVSIPQASTAQTPYASGAFIIKLGQDTVGVEKYIRTPNRVFGNGILVIDKKQRFYFDIGFNSDGVIDKRDLYYFEENEPGEWAYANHSITTFDGDSTRIENYALSPDSEKPISTFTQAFAGGYHLILMQIHAHAVFDWIASRMLTSSESRVDGQIPWGNVQTPFIVEKVNAQLVTTDNPNIMGKVRLHLDEEGNLVTMEGHGTARYGYTIHQIDLVAAEELMGLLGSSKTKVRGPHSPRIELETVVDGADIKIAYGQPSKRNREVFGGIVAWDEWWRTGANAATEFETSKTIIIEGHEIPAGRYSLSTIPSLSGWTLILNTKTGLWGTKNMYDESMDLVRLPMSSRELENVVEQLAISIEGSENGRGQLKIAWDATEASVDFEVK